MFSISAEWEASETGTPEERACFAAITILAGNRCLSEGHDPFVRRIRQAPYLSGYHLAEWLVWNWWRLRWEPRSQKVDWPFAHRLATAGSGYVWPNLTFLSDGQRIAIVARPSHDQGGAGFRYIADEAVILPAGDFERALERFVDQVAGQLEAEGLAGSNLDRLRADLALERRDGAVARFRKVEAMLGYDPDEAPAREVERLLADETLLGFSAVVELAAECNGRPDVIGARELIAIADAKGFETASSEAFRADTREASSWSETPAWLVGQRAARAARRELRLSDEPIDDRRLAELAAVDPGVLSSEGSAPLSFALKGHSGPERIVLRSRWRTGRRFELARIVGDRMMMVDPDLLMPVTGSQTYRQKLQRAFAAELLSPFASVDAMMEGDYSEEQQQDAAEHFEVSPLTIRTLLVNHRRIGREGFEQDVDIPSQNAA